MCRFSRGSPVYAVCVQRVAPVARSSAITCHSCSERSGEASPSPYRPLRNVAPGSTAHRRRHEHQIAPDDRARVGEPGQRHAPLDVRAGRQVPGVGQPGAVTDAGGEQAAERRPALRGRRSRQGHRQGQQREGEESGAADTHPRTIADHCSARYGSMAVPSHHRPGFAEAEDREVQVRRVLRRVAGGPHVADDLAGGDLRAFLQSVGVAIQMRVVVAEPSAAVVLIHGDAAAVTDEQLADDAGLHRTDRRPARREDVDRFVTAVATHLVEARLQRRAGDAVDGNPQGFLPQDLEVASRRRRLGRCVRRRRRRPDRRRGGHDLRVRRRGELFAASGLAPSGAELQPCLQVRNAERRAATPGTSSPARPGRSRWRASPVIRSRTRA